jgi:hypothetical protein
VKHPAPRQFATDYLAEFDERERLGRLTNQELVAEAWARDLDDEPIIAEMMRRLDPQYLDYQEALEKEKQ